MNRRDALKLIGLSAASPALLVREARLTGRTFTGDYIPTGFQAIDEALGGGCKRGEIYSFMGESAAAFVRSLAPRMGQKASVVHVTQRKTLPAEKGCREEDMNVTIWNPHEHKEIPVKDQWATLVDQHDVMVMDRSFTPCILSGEFACVGWSKHSFHTVVESEECTIVCHAGSWECRPHCLAPPHFAASLVLNDQGVDHQELGRLYLVSIVHNKRGPRHVFEPVVRYYRSGFIPLEESNYWNFDRKTNIVTGPYGKRISWVNNESGLLGYVLEV